MLAYLVLEDGTWFQGHAFGEPGRVSGEVVFNTGMTGYQEVLTDPSYCGQIVTMTYPLIGNYGINPEDDESARPQVRAFVVKELCLDPSHWQADRDLDQYLRQYGVAGIAGVDTRALTRHLRVLGTMRGLLAPSTDPEAPPVASLFLNAPGGLLAMTGEQRLPLAPALAGWLGQLTGQAGAFELHTHVAEVTTKTPFHLAGSGGGRHPKVVVMDYGLKQNILRHLIGLGCDVTVLPAYTPAAEIMALQPDGLFLTNGPGDPADAEPAVAAVREIAANTPLPIFGICLGHQVLGLALGAKAFKLKFGHRGANHPVKDYLTNRVYITSQNHGYAIDESTLPPGVTVTHRNLNDQTVEGLMHQGRRAFSVQYHPEAAPGPQESRYLFERFMDALGRS